MGDSESYTSISPMKIFSDYGYTGYNLGKSAQYIQNGYYDLIEVLKTQTPKIILIETNFVFRERSVKNGIENAAGRFIQKTLPIFEGHGKWKSILKSGIGNTLVKEKDLLDPMKGFFFNSNIVPYAGGDYVKQTDERKAIPELSKYFLDKLVALSEEKNFRIILYSSPSPTNWSYSAHNSINEYAQEKKIDYLDFNVSNKDIGIDWSRDTYDKGDHLNFYGAMKITKNIGQYLHELGILTDRRSDISFENWHTLLSEYRKRTSLN